MNQVLNTLSHISDGLFALRDMLWSGPLLIALFLGASYITWITGAVQFRRIGLAIKLAFTVSADEGEGDGNKPTDNKENSKENNSKVTSKNNSKVTSKDGDLSAFESLMTALAGAIGTGNITGIASAVAVGGLGAIFWMWVMAWMGMATAYAETLLSIKYRQQNQDGEISGGPMYYLLHGSKSKILAICYALFGALATYGGGCLVQSNSVVDAIVTVFPLDKLWVSIALSVVAGIVIIGGVKTIGRVAGWLVPFMALAYLGAGLFALGYYIDRVPESIYMIFSSAFTGQAAVGGFLGSTLLLAMQNGVQYGVFANEAGMGTLGIAGATARVNSPAEQGMRSIGGVFFSTMIVCTITGLVLAVTNVVGMQSASGELIKGSPLAIAAFATVADWFSYIVTIGLVLFAFTTLVAWAYYGEKCIEFLFGNKVAHGYRWLYTLGIVWGGIESLDKVWGMAHLAVGLMTLPNIIGIIILRRVVRDSNQY